MDIKKIAIIFSLLSVFNVAQASWFGDIIPTSVTSLFRWSGAAATVQTPIDQEKQRLFEDLVKDNNLIGAYAVLAVNPVNLNVTFADGETFLHRAVKAELDPKMIKTAVERGVNVNARDAGGRTAYYLAELRYQPAIMAALVLTGADIEIPDANGRTGKQMYEVTHRDRTPHQFSYTPGSSSGNPSVARFALPTPSAQAAALPGNEMSVLSLGRAAAMEATDELRRTDVFKQQYPGLALLTEAAKDLAESKARK